MITAAHLKRGQQAEDTALNYLEKKGLKLVARNVRYPFGELDIIMTEGKKLVFVEVKYRQSQQYGGAIQSISSNKIKRLRRAANCYLQRQQLDTECRFDVVAIDADDIQWITNAF